ncbi:MAG: beta-lactamase family protein [Bacteroidetes bacterium]|nr:beta-lactamase family protein [Bacteroidota bacterium]
MRVLIPKFLTVPLLAFLLVACHSDKGQVKAFPAPKFHETPRAFTDMDISFADTTAPEWQPIKASLDSFYRDQVARGFNGSVLIGHKGKILYERYFGWANRETKLPWSGNTPSQLASTSKTITATAILFLYEHKYLDIDQEVSTYLKGFPYKGITVRMLLNHRSGLPDYTHWAVPYVNGKTPITNDDLFNLLVKVRPKLGFSPNTHFKYSNTNFALLASIIEVVTERKYPVFLQEFLFRPLGMNHTFVFDPVKGFPANAAMSYKYNWQIDPVMFADGIYGDKGIYSTVEDMYKWDQSFYKNKILDNETMELAYGPCSFERKGIKNYGLGWRMLCYPDGYKIIYHNGWWHGNNTCFYRFIKDNFTVIVLGNKFNRSIYRQPQAVFNIVNGSANRETDEGAE